MEPLRPAVTMNDHPLADWPTLATLEAALERHRKELRAIKRMSDAQYAAFRANFAIGAIEMPRAEAMDLLATMIGTNLRMQNILRRTGRGRPTPPPPRHP